MEITQELIAKRIKYCIYDNGICLGRVNSQEEAEALIEIINTPIPLPEEKPSEEYEGSSAKEML